jgi:uncharacterized delta-60 repeat protein
MKKRGSMFNRCEAIHRRSIGNVVIINARAIVLSAFALFTSAMNVAWAQSVGELDTSFGPFANGTFPAFGVGDDDDFMRAMAVQPDGKIVLAGSCKVTTSLFHGCVARVNADGIGVDAEFDGPSTTPGNGRFLMPLGSGSSSIRAVAIQSDGKIVLAGGCFTGGVTADICVVRLNAADGSYDTSFGGGAPLSIPGVVTVALSATQDDEATKLLQQPDGKLLLGGECKNSFAQIKICLVRLNADGSLDDSFDGPFATPGNGKTYLSLGIATDETLSGMTLYPDGRILLAATCNAATEVKMCVARLMPSGGWDVSFNGPMLPGGAGRFKIDLGVSAFEYASALALQADGRIVVVGYCLISGGSQQRRFCTARLRDTGTFDPEFDGPNATAGDGRFTFSLFTGVDLQSPSQVIVQPDGKLLMVGGCTNTTFAQSDLCIARLNPDGSFDRSLSGASGSADGRVRFDIAGGARNDLILSAQIVGENKLMLGGYCANASGNFDGCVARMHLGTSSAQTCSLDIDGDGQVIATVDSLIHARIALGIRGPSVIANITFPSNATRNNWTRIRDYLFFQCGLNVY